MYSTFADGVGAAVFKWIRRKTTNSGVASSIPCFPVFWMRLLTEVQSPNDLVGGGTFIHSFADGVG